MKKIFLGLVLLVFALSNTAFADEQTAVTTPVAQAKPVVHHHRAKKVRAASSKQAMVSATPTATPVNDGGKMFWGVGVDLAPTLNGFGSVYSAGWGGNANIGFNLDNNWGLMAMLDGYSFATSTSGYSSTEFTLTPDLKLTFDGTGVKPYLFAGAGLNDNIFNTPSAFTSTISFAYNGGAGLAFSLDTGLDLQVQVEYESVITTNGSFAYLPISAGLQFN